MGFARFLAAALAGSALPVFGDGRQIRDFTYVGDVVAATLAAADAQVAPGTVLNVAGGSEISVLGLVERLSSLLGRTLAVEHQPEQPGDVRRTGGAIDRARDLLGWAPATSLADGLRAQIAATGGG